jgi:hypothetical protein
VATKLIGVGSYAPGLSATALEAYNTAFQLYQTGLATVNSATSAYLGLTGQGGETVINGSSTTRANNQNQQQKYFQQFYGYWKNRTLFTVQTPWAIFQDCAIQSLRAIQGEETNTITDFEVTFKLLRFASTLTITPGTTTAGNAYGRLQNQSSSLINLGPQTVITSPTSFVSVA